MNEFRRLINRKVVIGFIALLVINICYADEPDWVRAVQL